MVVTGKAARLLEDDGRMSEKEDLGLSAAGWAGWVQSGWLMRGGGSRLRAERSASGMTGSADGLDCPERFG